MYDEQVILLFIKAPVMGQVKSRLAADVGEETALVLYKSFILDIVNTLARSRYSFRICFYPPEGEKVISEWLGPHYEYMPQRGNDLGAKMANAFHRIFSEGAARGVLIGSDIPDLPFSILNEAFESLKNNDAVIGPAADGGYYLIGFNQDSFLPCVFDGITWSTDTVYQETVRVLQDASLRVHHLPQWGDVDALGDLQSLVKRNRDTMFDQSMTMEYLRNTRLLEKKETQTMSKQKKQIILLIVFLAVIIAIRYSPVGAILTFDNLKQHRNTLLSFVQDNYSLSVILFLVTYICTTAFSIPGATILTLAGGFLFGTVIAAVCINVGATAGGTLAFLSARYLLGERLQEKYQSQLIKFNTELEKNGAQYLLTLRFIPVFPFFLINFLSGLTKIPIKTFVWTTSIGIIPGTVVYAFAGQQIGSINSPSEILSTNVIIAFILLALFAIMPVIINRIKDSKKQHGT